MGEDRQREAALDLVWSLWTELGVPGPRRDHLRAIVDPERLLVVTPWFAQTDARLSDLVFAWCVQHGTRLSGSRLTALLRTAHPDVRLAAAAFLSELAAAGVPLVRIQPLASARPRSHRDLPIAADRPALLRLRTRALVGVGGRADLLVALLSGPETWASASSLVDEVGMAKRHIARVLAELADGIIVHSRQRGNVREFRLANPGALAELVALAEDAVFPRWNSIFEWMRLAAELVALPADMPATLRVEVARRKDTLLGLAIELGIPHPAPSEATDAGATIAWASKHARAMADGTADAVRGPSSGSVGEVRRG
jgi:DNA-binding transcriptional ArsR family regulator